MREFELYVLMDLNTTLHVEFICKEYTQLCLAGVWKPLAFVHFH